MSASFRRMNDGKIYQDAPTSDDDNASMITLMIGTGPVLLNRPMPAVLGLWFKHNPTYAEIVSYTSSYKICFTRTAIAVSRMLVARAVLTVDAEGYRVRCWRPRSGCRCEDDPPVIHGQNSDVSRLPVIIVLLAEPLCVWMHSAVSSYRWRPIVLISRSAHVCRRIQPVSVAPASLHMCVAGYWGFGKPRRRAVSRSLAATVVLLYTRRYTRTHEVCRRKTARGRHGLGGSDGILSDGQSRTEP